MKEKKSIKQKISVDLLPENYKAIEDYKRELLQDTRVFTTTTQTINDCVSLLLNTSEEFKKDLAKFCKEKLQGVLPTSLHEEAEACEGRKWEELYYFLTNGRGIPENEKGLKRVDFQNGYIIVPSDWIFINPNAVNNEYYLYPYIIEFRNGSKFNLPHFFLLSQTERISGYIEESFLDEACEKYPPLKDVLPKVARAIIDDKGQMLNYDIWSKSPEPGFFPFPKVRGYQKSVMGELWVPKDLLDELDAE